MWLMGLSACMVLDTENKNQSAESTDTDHFLDQEEENRDEYLSELIVFEGRVIDLDGRPLGGVTLSLQGQQAQSDSEGHFSFEGLQRANANLELRGPGLRAELFPVHLAVETDIAIVRWPPLPMVSSEEGLNRVYFAGDVALGRRFLELNPSERDQFPSNDPDALISVDDPTPGSIATTQWMVPYFELADGAILNLESPVTDNPQNPHPTKDYVFFTLPESLVILPTLGIDFVTLGNNHIYDYQDQGLIDTFNFVEAWGIPFGGAGLTPETAWTPQTIRLGSGDYTLISASSINGAEHAIGYSANEVQGGSADLRNTDDFINAFSDSEHPQIALLHTGNEYENYVSSYSENRAQLAIENGAELVISHHPHVTQHWGVYQDKYIFHSLGNFIFDQDRMDTMMAVVAEVDIGTAVERARAFPIYIEDYRPRPVAGALADRFLVALSERSELYGVQAISYLGRSWVDDGGWSTEARELELTAEPDQNGSAILDLRPILEAGERIVDVQFSAGTLRYGSDLMVYGDIEDYDVDEDAFEAARWDVDGESRYVCTDETYRGVAALCSVRDASNTGAVSTAFRHRIRVLGDSSQPNRAVSFVGQRREEGTGETRVRISFYASVEDAYFGDQVIAVSEGGTSDWQQVWADIQIPEDPSDTVNFETEAPRGIRVFLEQDPPQEGQGRMIWDDLALVTWESEPSYQLSPTFLRLDGLSASARVQLTLQKSVRRE